jgi:hypothetical protein
LLNIGAGFSDIFFFRGTVTLSMISITLNLITVAPLVQIVRGKLYSVLHRQTNGSIRKWVVGPNWYIGRKADLLWTDKQTNKQTNRQLAEADVDWLLNGRLDWPLRRNVTQIVQRTFFMRDLQYPGWVFCLFYAVTPVISAALRNIFFLER